MSNERRNRQGHHRSAARSRGERHRSAQAPSDRARSADAPRLAAYTLLREVSNGAYANLVLPNLLRDKGIRGVHAAFATELAYGTIRWRGLYDAVLAACVDRPLADVDPNVLDTLRLGTHQLLAMRVPAHAATGETVALARQVNGAGAAGFVNAVLRRVGERSREHWLASVTEGIEDPVARLAVEHSHPEWVVKAMRAAVIGHGRAPADQAMEPLQSWLVADNTPAAVSLVARPGLSSVAELVEAGAVASVTSPVGAVLAAGDPGAIDAVRDGRAAVQDEGSQLLTLALARAEVSGIETSDERWLDMCAGPGGKAGLLGALAIEQRIPFTANEISNHRTDLVRATTRPLRALAKDLGVEVEIRTGDGRDIGAEEPGRYSRVLIDAPCSGLGALRRRPDSRWTRTVSDVTALSSLQRQLLASGIEATRPGGLIGYATCSPHLSETRFVVQDVLKKRADVEVIDARELFVTPSGEQLEQLGDGPFVQLWPDVHGTDAMFLALLRKL